MRKIVSRGRFVPRSGQDAFQVLMDETDLRRLSDITEPGFFQRIRDTYKDGKKKKLVENFFSLSLLQGINYLLPFITLPYLTRVLGVGNFGLVMFAQAFIQYFIMFTDYGFNLSATREIAVNRENIDRISEIFSAVLFIKMILTVFGFAVLCLIVFAVDKFSSEWMLYLFTYGIVIGYTLFPVWLFQGMERMKYITLLSIAAKLVFTVSIFIVIRERSDFLYVPVLNSLGFILAGILGIWIAIKRFRVRFLWPCWSNLRNRMTDGFHIFATSFLPQLYNSSTTFILGLLTNHVLVGYYAAAAKVVDALNSIIYVISQTFFPYLNRQLSSHKSFRNIIIGTGLVLSAIIFWKAELLVNIIFGSEYAESIMLLRILAFCPLFVATIVCYGTNYLLIIKEDKLYLRITMISSIIGFSAAWVLIPLLAQTGAGLNLLFSRALLGLLTLAFAVRFIKREAHQKSQVAAVT
ncbi:MAG: flippase [Candidatus Zixiibacteriota bacterium]|nr:MAG: flippase [candidate division Zixibacteria bacterium]